jgi:DNA-binding NtrC family response regulator
VKVAFHSWHVFGNTGLERVLITNKLLDHLGAHKMADSTAKVLVVDDDSEMLQFLQRILSRDGLDITTCSSGAEALLKIKKIENGESTFKSTDFDVILSDVRMPSLDGLTLVNKLREAGNETPVILMTAYGSIQSAVDAIKQGAHDYLTKPLQINDVRETIKRTLEYREVVNKNDYKTEGDRGSPTSSNLIALNQRMKDIIALIRRVAHVDTTVLILGESGTGKEVIAQAIHNQGDRKNKKFVAINCAAIPEELLESELFGHAKGSFTGATGQKSGLFEEAEGGTIFLDEIGDMPLSLQAKLLRVLQERKIRPVGSNVSKDINVRIIAATHRDLRTAMVDGQFREDLYYRLSVIPIVIPPLRERPEDIFPLAEYFLKKACTKTDSPLRSFTEGALNKLRAYPWKGNVRELENTIERAVVLSPNTQMTEDDLDFLQTGDVPSSGVVTLSSEGKSLDLRHLEKEALVLALQKSGGRKEEAAKILGISRKTLYRKEREYGIAPE